MIILTDTYTASLLMAAERLSQHEMIINGEMFTEEVDGSYRELVPQVTVIDISIALAEDKETLDDAINELIDGGGSRELLITIGQVPPWEREKIDQFLEKLGEGFGALVAVEESFGVDFRTTWYVPEPQSTIRKIATMHEQTIKLEKNPYYEKIQDQQWCLTHHEDLDKIDKALLLHRLEYVANSEVLAKLLLDIARNKVPGEVEK